MGQLSKEYVQVLFIYLVEWGAKFVLYAVLRGLPFLESSLQTFSSRLAVDLL